MMPFILILFYIVLLASAFFSLSYVKNIGCDPIMHVIIILAIIIAVLILQSYLFSEIYHSVYASNHKSFAGSDLYKVRKQEGAVKSLWLSKDIKGNYYFPNWLLLELSDYLLDAKNLDVFYKGYELFYRTRLTYDELRLKLSKEYPELLIRVMPRPLPPNMPTQGNVIDLPGINEFVLRLSSSMEKYEIKLNVHSKQDPLLNNLAVSLLTLLSGLSEDVPISRLDVLLDVKSEEMLGLFGTAVSGEKRDQIRADIEKTIFFYLARRMLIRTNELPTKLERGDFLFYSALSFFSANMGDVQPVSIMARSLTFAQVLGTFVILALAIAFLGGVVGGINGIPFSFLKGLVIPGSLLVGIAAFIAIAAMCITKYTSHRLNADILRIQENYGYSPQMDGSVNVMINVNNPAQSGHLSKHYSLAMPYHAVFGENMRYPGILVTKKSAMIVWAEILPPAIDRIHVYGDGYDIGEIAEPYKLLIPASFTAFSSQ